MYSWAAGSASKPTGAGPFWTTGRIWAAMIIVVVAILSILVFRASKMEAERRAASTTANAVTELPPGFRDAWMSSLKTALESQLVVQGGRLRIPGVFSGVTWAPTSQIAVNCDPLLGVYLTYGQGDNAEELVIFGSHFFADRADFMMPEFGPGLGSRSPAVAGLMDETCAAISTVLKNQGR